MFKDLLKRVRQWWSQQPDLTTPRISRPSVPSQATAQPLEVKTGRNEGRSSRDDGAIQLPPSNDGGRVLVIRIGLDFGTAFTKAAIGLAGAVLPVRWSKELGSEGYFLPGVLSEMR